MQKTLGAYTGQLIHISVTNHQSELLDALLYVGEIGSAAEDSGKILVVPKATATKGKISISIVIDNKDS
jgi:hypothetical protein